MFPMLVPSRLKVSVVMRVPGQSAEMITDSDSASLARTDVALSIGSARNLVNAAYPFRYVVHSGGSSSVNYTPSQS